MFPNRTYHHEPWPHVPDPLLYVERIRTAKKTWNALHEYAIREMYRLKVIDTKRNDEKLTGRTCRLVVWPKYCCSMFGTHPRSLSPRVCVCMCVFLISTVFLFLLFSTRPRAIWRSHTNPNTREKKPQNMCQPVKCIELYLHNQQQSKASATKHPK